MAEPKVLTTDNAAEASVSMGAIMAAAQDPAPSAPETHADIVDLPGGLVNVLGDGELIVTARIRELNGADEEKIFRAVMSRKTAVVLDTIISCGLVSLGDEDEKATRKLMPFLLIGDRDAILIAIRTATYDAKVEITDWTCPECAEKTNITFDLDEDVTTRKLEVPGKVTFTVSLRNGAKALVHLPNGKDQLVVGENIERTVVERNTIIIQRCVEEVSDSRGVKHVLSAFPSYAQQMGIKDRHTILEEITRRQPGPQFTKVEFTHQSCGKEVSLALDLVDLFLF